MPQRPHPYDMIADERKTTLSASGGVTLGYGPGPGLRHANFWNRIGSLYSCYRPAVALLTVFSAEDPHTPLALSTVRTNWHPNHCAARYEGLIPAAPGRPAARLEIHEDRYGTKTGLVCRLRFSVGAGRRPAQQRASVEGSSTLPYTIILCFHGQVQQSAFFDYMRRSTAEELAQGRPPGFDEPLIKCNIEPGLGMVTLTQPHPHDGLLKPDPAHDPKNAAAPKMVAAVNSIQRVWLSQELSAGGFCQSESELHTLWHDHGVESSIRMRLGQVGGRWSADQWSAKDADESSALQISARAPLYYMTTRLSLEPGESKDIVIQSDFHTDDPGGDLRPAAQLEWEAKHGKPYRLSSKAVDRELAAEEKTWRRYLDSEVPQLECSDKPLERYWYYVWYVLRANRTAPGTHITAPFTAPSKYMYWGPWIWDAYFHVLGERWLSDPGIAKDSIRAVLQMQFPNGFIPVCSGSQYRMCFHEDVPGYRSPTGGGYASYVPAKLRGYKEDAHLFEASFKYMDHAGKYGLWMSHNEKTQTPLITPAVRSLFELRQSDLDAQPFALECYVALKAYDDWLWRRRTDSAGRFTLWHGDESGWDDATRHYPVPALPFDVQIHSFMHRGSLRALWLMAGNNVGGTPEDPLSDFEKLDETVRLRKTLQALGSYWDAQDRWHYDLAPGADGGAAVQRKQIAASGLFALLTGLPKERVQLCIDSLRDALVFGRPYPIPSLAACDPDYKPHGWGWNGPVWLQLNYFTLTGLLQRGESQAAWRLWEQTRDLIIRDGKPHSFELYDPELGSGMGCPDYSWQAMILNLIIEHFAGVQGAILRPALPPDLKRLKLSRLPGRIKSVSLRRSGMKLKLKLHTEPGELLLPLEDQPGRQLALELELLGRVKLLRLNGERLRQDDSGWWVTEIDHSQTTDWGFEILCR